MTSESLRRGSGHRFQDEEWCLRLRVAPWSYRVDRGLKKCFSSLYRLYTLGCYVSRMIDGRVKREKIVRFAESLGARAISVSALFFLLAAFYKLDPQPLNLLMKHIGSLFQ
jgi:hypothetical protein